MTTRINGICNIIGEPDTGKTICALQVAHPSKIAYFHDDVKSPPVAPESFGKFYDLVQVKQEGNKGLKLLEFREYVLNLIKHIKPGQYEAIIFDTWARFGLSLRQYAISNPAEFRELTTFSKLGSAKGGEMWNEAHRYEAQVISDLAKLAPFVGLVTHLKDQYEGGAKTGQKRPDAGKAFDRVCNFRIWLRSNPDSGVPIALVLKRLNESVVTDRGLEVVNVLPWKLTPTSEDGSVWDVIDRYRTNPFGNRSAMPHELPDSFEMSILTGVMTKEQRQIWQANLKERHLVEQEEMALVSSEELQVTQRVRELEMELGRDVMKILMVVNKERQEVGLEGLTPGEVSSRMNGQ